jgi:hypothetical protein
MIMLAKAGGHDPGLEIIIVAQGRGFRDPGPRGAVIATQARE